jgi:ComF family protein
MLCARTTPRELCTSCRNELPPIPPPFEVSGVSVRAAARYDAPLDGVVWRLKYQDRPDLARPLARFVSERVPRENEAWLVPVPLHPERLAERGYNQATLLARSLGRIWGVRVAPRGLGRSRHTEQQARLSRAARHDNLRDAFVCLGELRGQSVVLVDDVITTGATAAAAIETLVGCGANVMAVVAIARAGGA